MNEDRAVVLLKATLKLLKKCEASPYVLDVMGETAFYDEAECDGYCLKDDIEHYLEWEVEKK